MSTSKIVIDGITIDNITSTEAVDRISKSILSKFLQEREKGYFTVTPNLDHFTQLRKNKAFKSAYLAANLVLTDGFPIKLISKLKLGSAAIKEVIPGSELTPNIFSELNSSLDSLGKCNIYILGADDNTVRKVNDTFSKEFVNLKVVGSYTGRVIPTDRKLVECISIEIREKRVDLVVASLGAPKQELICSQLFYDNPYVNYLCVGATLEFFVGEKRRAPVIMRKLKLEWLHRWLSEPKRLTKRYVACFFTLYHIMIHASWRLK